MTLRDMLPASVAIHHDYESLEIEYYNYIMPA